MSAPAGMPVWFVVPDAIDDPDRVSGGNVYDQHVRDGLRLDGWHVRMVLIPDGRGSLTARTLCELPDGALILIDGLIAVRESQSLLAQSGRLRIVVLAHMVTGIEREREALRTATCIIATSEWTRSELVARDLAGGRRVIVAHPGTDPAAATVASRFGGRLLCVGVVAPHKGQDLLVRALAGLTDVNNWTCTFVGSVDAASGFINELTHTIERSGLTARATFAGVLAGPSLEDAYGRADLVIVPSRTESYGMVVAEALVRGIPVVAARVGGIPEAMSGSAAGILVPPEDPWALEVVLRQWLASPARRSQLKTAAMGTRETARPWSVTIATVESALYEVALSQTAVSA